MDAKISPANIQLVFDTNVLVDALLARGPFYRHAMELLEMVKSGGVEGWYAPHCLTTIYYLIENTLRKETSKKAAIETSLSLIKQLTSILKPLPQIGNELATADELDIDDREDALIVYLAKLNLPNPLIVSRDEAFLKQSGTRAAHPREITENGVGKYAPEDLPIEFIDLKTQQRAITPKLQERIHTVLRHGRYILGPEVQELEERLAEYVGVKHCIGVASGTDSLLIAMMALGIGLGDEVITVPYTWISTAEMIALLGAKPVFVDIEPDTWNMDPSKLEAAITDKTKAIMPVGIYGQTADMKSINAIAARHGDIPVIEDAAQCFGATHHGKRSCGLSLIGSTSFFPSKPLGCYGDGGALFTDDDALAQAMRQIRAHGQAKKHHHPILGLNGRLDTFQAAIVLCKLDRFDREIEQRQEVAGRYAESLEGCPDMELPVVREGNTSVYAQYTIISPERDALTERLKEAGIPAVSYYAVPLHLQPVFASLNHRSGDFPVTEKVSSQCLSLPMSPGLTVEEQQRIRNAFDIVSKSVHMVSP